jgi:sigma-B regulation protein RsbU (phosphoserine phosphatase)
MAVQKPVSIRAEDWTQMSPTVRDFVIQSINQIEYLETKLQDIQTQLNQNVRVIPHQKELIDQEDSLVGHLLVVDDNEMNRDMLSRRLKRQGHTVKVAMNGRQALEMMQAEAFDLVLLDIMMPEMNGYEALEQMKTDSLLAHIPVIMISAVDEMESIVRCIKLGAEDYLPKPFNATLLKARISASLEKKRLRDQQEAYIRQLDIENQRKSAELEQARRMQRSLLPTAPPKLPQLDIAAYQETASEVGGDYYDFFPQPDGRLLIAIGDATGHGVGSGLLVSMTKASLLTTNETDLKTLIRIINGILNEIDLGVQLNMALLLLEVSQMRNGQVTVRVCGGGMPPVYILRAANDLREMMVCGLPLAITEEAVYEVTEFKLQAGDTMLLMTDGLSEMFNPRQEFLTFDRLMAAMANIDITGLTAKDILKQVVDIGHVWAEGQPIYDDVTLVVVRAKDSIT